MVKNAETGEDEERNGHFQKSKLVYFKQSKAKEINVIQELTRTNTDVIDGPIGDEEIQIIIEILSEISTRERDERMRKEQTALNVSKMISKFCENIFCNFDDTFLNLFCNFDGTFLNFFFVILTILF